MSTATYDRPLYAVPPPATKARFAFLLALRRRAEQALDTLLALPRSAAGWALRHVRALLDAASDHSVLAWIGARISDTAHVVRGIGLVPIAAALLSTPPVWSATTRLVRAASAALHGFGRGLWARTKTLLGRGGTLGADASRALSTAGTWARHTVHTVATHPAIQPVTQVVKSLAGLVRPVSHSVVVHRLVGLLVPSLWVRVALELLALPLLLVPALPGQVRAGLRPTPSSAPTPVPVQAPGAAGAANGEATQQAPTAPETDDATLVATPVAAEPLNRAERRAQQQEQARAKRASARH
ncbi:hypothetical protein [Pedococcus sp. 2YAF34]|uniref:hypothetical protein n=1 Tax=Pedococcus sp. 2YAF34 TaxID=3233032 RepID=UPI003F9A5CFD